MICLECRAAPGFICAEHQMTDNHNPLNDDQMEALNLKAELAQTRLVLADLLAVFSASLGAYSPAQEEAARNARAVLGPMVPKARKP